MRFRLYVDEVGNSDLRASGDPNHRFLSLTGLIVQQDHANDVLAPQLEAIKRRCFGSHADDPVILHRKDLVNKKSPFGSLRDPVVEAEFNTSFLDLVKNTEFQAITVVIDKLEHQQKFTVWRHDPYHYCQEILIERYVLWLKRGEAVGDVLAEARGKREDERLKNAFARIYEHGTDFVSDEDIKTRLTSRELKVAPKSRNVAGLQLADLIAHPCFVKARCIRDGQPAPINFGTRVVEIVENEKWLRGPEGQIEGWGWIWLP